MTPPGLAALPDLLTVTEAAQFLRISRTTAYAEAKRFELTGEGLPVIRVGRSLRAPRAALQRLVAGEVVWGGHRSPLAGPSGRCLRGVPLQGIGGPVSDVTVLGRQDLLLGCLDGWEPMLEVDRLARGHEEADEEVFRRVYPRLRRFAAAWTSPSDDPDDLVQEALARTLARHSLIDLDEPLAYLQRAVANLAKNTYRARARVAPGRIDRAQGGDVYPSDLADLERLRPEDRAALYLVDVEGVGMASAADILGCTTAVLSGRLKRGRRLLERVVTKEQQRG